ncbi:XRE family transcriptional regulator [Streptomyces sp. NPDC046931]|uniref:XRE family transcriptional regulator n=1 Tax=Streptomyces sp. NPDC046931 TaxID=3154806 RepID=UPI0033E05784
MGDVGDVSPYEAQDAAGFVESLQRLKERSGLTYRELEERAARNGEMLARSTLAGILRRTSLPRPDLLAAFVRACGDGERVDAWLDARDRIAAGVAVVPVPDPRPGSATAPAPPRAEGSTTPRPHRTGRRGKGLAALLVVPPLALAAWGLFPGGSDDSGAPAASATASRPVTDGWVTIRPARTPALCLTDGRDRGGAYPNAVAVQLPCARATVPRTYLEPVGGGLYRIQWHHPQEGRGCLTVMSAGPVKGMLEPRDDCARATLFRLEPAAADGSAGYRLRVTPGGRCVGIVDDDTTEGAEAAEEPCTGGSDQRFVVRTD